MWLALPRCTPALPRPAMCTALPPPAPTSAPTSTAPPPDRAAALAGAWHQRLALLLDSTGDGMFGIDDRGCCTFINRAGAQMLGWRTEQVLGRNMHELVHHRHADGRDYPEPECPIFNAFRQGLPCRVDSEVLWRADGSAFPAEYSSYPVEQDGRVIGAVVTFVDITERKRAEAGLHQTREDLERRVADRTTELSSALAQLRELAAYAETVREDERTRIAREIHDELGSLLVALKMDVGWLAKRVDDRAPLAAKCQGMGRLIDTAVDNLGRIITDLRPSILDHQGLWAALEWQAQEFIDSAELDARLQVVVPAGAVAPAGAQATAVFRIFQEVLSNVARHAQARRVRIRIDVDPPPAPMLYIEVRDDGVGAPPEALNHPRSYGVMGLRERARHFGGRLRIDSAPGQGTRVRLAMPIHAAEAP